MSPQTECSHITFISQARAHRRCHLGVSHTFIARVHTPYHGRQNDVHHGSVTQRREETPNVDPSPRRRIVLWRMCKRPQHVFCLVSRVQRLSIPIASKCGHKHVCRQRIFCIRGHSANRGQGVPDHCSNRRPLRRGPGTPTPFPYFDKNIAKFFDAVSKDISELTLALQRQMSCDRSHTIRDFQNFGRVSLEHTNWSLC